MTAVKVAAAMTALAALVLPGWRIARAEDDAAPAPTPAPAPAPVPMEPGLEMPLSAEKNRAAFLAAIRFAEGTYGRADPYRVCFGYRHTIQNLAEHPAVSGEWTGETLSADMCRAAGFNPGCKSTAAGAYQIIKPTWLALRKKIGAQDFGPAAQDAAALELLRQVGALQHVDLGQFEAAIKKSARTWASLPAAGWGQPERNIEQLQAAYIAAGGGLA